MFRHLLFSKVRTFCANGEDTAPCYALRAPRLCLFRAFLKKKISPRLVCGLIASRGIISLKLDNKGRVVVKYTYNAWGECSVTVLDASATAIANLNPFRYRCYYYDTETNLYFLKTRYYDPEIARFMTIDAVRYLNSKAINGLNLYAYCGNNPIKYFDRTGCFAEWIIPILIVAAGAIVGGIFGASLSVATPGNMEIEYPTPETNPNIIVPNKPLEDTNIINTNPGNEENLSPKPETKDLSLGERFANIIIWSSIGACFGCTVGFVVSPCLFFMGETAIARVIMAASIAFGLIFQTVSIAFGVFIDMPSENPFEPTAPQLPDNNQEFRYPN